MRSIEQRAAFDMRAQMTADDDGMRQSATHVRPKFGDMVSGGSGLRSKRQGCQALPPEVTTIKLFRYEKEDRAAIERAAYEGMGTVYLYTESRKLF